MTRTLAKYWPFTVNGLQVLLTYRISFVMAALAGGISLAIQVSLWTAVYQGRSDLVLGGLTLPEMLGYVVAAQSMAILLGNRAEHEVAADVMRGDIAVNLVRPLNYEALRFFSCLPIIASNALFVALPLLALAALTDLLAVPRLSAPFVLSALLSFGTGFLINFIFGCAAFWTTNVWGIQVCKSAVVGLLSGQLLPLSFFGGWIETVAGLLPFQGLVYTPLRILLGMHHGAADLVRMIGLQVFWLAVLLLLSRLVWRRAERRLEILGG